jgi:hypothetical protein
MNLWSTEKALGFNAPEFAGHIQQSVSNASEGPEGAKGTI